MRHIIGFYSHGIPKVVIREKEVAELELIDSVSLELSFNRYCIGYTRIDKDYPCPDEAMSDSAQCGHCRKLELSCASCKGDECRLGLGKECMLGEHYVYLASFGEFVKAGVTKKERINERLIEQGADFGVVVAKAKDGFAARKLEAEIQKKFGFRNAMRTTEKFRLLFSEKEIGRKSIEAGLEKLKGFDGLEMMEILDLSGHYPTLTEKPTLDNLLIGKVLGAKGKMLFLERNGTKAVDMGRMIGKYITKE